MSNINMTDTNYVAMRIKEEYHEEVLKLIKKSKGEYTRWCFEDTGGNPHYHYLFYTKLAISTLRTYRQQTTIPKGQQHMVLKKMEIKDGLTEDQTIQRYERYMCKGHDVSLKRSHEFFKDGKYIGKPPITHGIMNPEKKHESFWKNHKEFCLSKKLTAKHETGTSRFVSYLEDHYKKEPLTDQSEKGLRTRYKDIILEPIINLAYEYCRKMDRSCIETVVKNLVSAGLNRYDDTGIFRKKETYNLIHYFLDR